MVVDTLIVEANYPAEDLTTVRPAKNLETSVGNEETHCGRSKGFYVIGILKIQEYRCHD